MAAVNAIPDRNPQLDAAVNQSDSQLDSMLAKQQKRDDEGWAKQQSLMQGMERERYDFDTNFKPPTPKPLPEPPKQHLRDPMESFGSVASTLAIFGSLLTRRPLTNALNAAAGAMHAYRSEDIEQANYEFASWKANIENFKAQHQFEVEAYDAALKKLETDQHGALAEIQAIAASTKNETMSMLAQQRNLEGLFKIQETQKLNAAKIDELTGKLEDMNAKALGTIESNKLWQQFLKENPNAPNDQKIAKYNEIYHPAAAASQQRADAATGGHGAALTPKQDADMARQAFDTMFPKNISGRRPGTMQPDGTVKPAPGYEAWLTNEWPKLREKFIAEHRGGAAPAAAAATPAPAAATPTEHPNPAAPPKPAADAAAPPIAGAIRAQAASKEKDGTHIDLNGKHFIKQGDWLIPLQPQAANTATPPADGSRPPDAESAWTGTGGDNPRGQTGPVVGPVRQRPASSYEYDSKKPGFYADGTRIGSDSPLPIPDPQANLSRSVKLARTAQLGNVGDVLNQPSQDVLGQPLPTLDDIKKMQAGITAKMDALRRDPHFARDRAGAARQNKNMNQIESEASGNYQLSHIYEKFKELHDWLDTLINGDPDAITRRTHRTVPRGGAGDIQSPSAPRNV